MARRRSLRSPRSSSQGRVPAAEQLEALLNHAVRVQENSDWWIRLRRGPNLDEQSEELVIKAYLEVFAGASDAAEDDPKSRFILGVAADNLGLYFKNRRHGEARSNRAQSMKYIGRAIRLFDRETFPGDWAAANVNLGNAYLTRRDGNAVSDLDVRSAIRRYELALEVMQAADDDPGKLANLYDNLVGAYAILSSGDRMRNLEIALD